jgi:hypothetical protein
VPVTRRGWTLHEMLISLCVMSGVFAIVAHQASTQIRLYSGIQRATLAREHRAQASAMAGRVLWSVSPGAGDVTMALDSALQIEMPIGASAVCESSPGTVVIAAPTLQRGPVLAAFTDTPEPGDRLVALFHDSLGTTWLGFRVASMPVLAACARYPTSPGWRLSLAEPVQLGAGAALRFLRPLRLSLYRASDARWYLGAKEWNGEQQRFNTIQPIAGPYDRYDRDQGISGLVFRYADRAGGPLHPPIDPARIASISITARSTVGPVADSGTVTVSLRNAQ